MERIDLLIFGASGFTGKYAVEAMTKILTEYPSITWGLAGRSHAKLNIVLKNVGITTGKDLTDIPIIIADVGDEESLLEMAKRAKVILNCCGPFRHYGEPVVKACITAGTHHLDVTGEPYFMELMQFKYDQEARDAGVYIISACGFDCIPNDLGVVFLESQFKGTVNSVESYLSFNYPPDMKVGAIFHYATFESAVYGFAHHHELSSLRKKLFQEKMPSLTPKLKSRPVVHQSKNDGRWYIHFSGADPSVLLRTQRYFMSTKKKRPIQIRVYCGFVSLMTVLCIIIYGAFFSFAVRFESARQIMLRNPKTFSLGAITHEGPTKEVMDNMQYCWNLHGSGWDESITNINKVPPNKTIKVQVTGYDPGYGSTCVSLILSGITVIREQNLMPGSGGVLTAGAAFSETSLIKQLHNHDIKFEVLSNGSKPKAHL